MNIDRLAYISKLKNKDPLQKTIFALLTVCVCLWANEILISILIIVTMGFITVAIGKIYFTVFLKLMLLPMSFLIIGVITIAVGTSVKPDDFLLSYHLKESYIGVSSTGISDSLNLFFKACGAISCLYFLSLNTPMINLMSALKRLKVPKLFLELTNLMYRFIFLLMELTEIIFTAQNARLGYSRISSGYRSLGILVASVFIKAYKRSDELYISLECRGYDGEFNVIDEFHTLSEYQKDTSVFIYALLINAIFILLAIYLNNNSNTFGGVF